MEGEVGEGDGVKFCRFQNFFLRNKGFRLNFPSSFIPGPGLIASRGKHGQIGLFGPFFLVLLPPSWWHSGLLLHFLLLLGKDFLILSMVAIRDFSSGENPDGNPRFSRSSSAR